MKLSRCKKLNRFTHECAKRDGRTEDHKVDEKDAAQHGADVIFRECIYVVAWHAGEEYFYAVAEFSERGTQTAATRGAATWGSVGLIQFV